MNGCILILGNGFDLDLGLHTSYSDFWISDRWKKAKETCPDQYFVSSLESYRLTHNWFDLESGLKERAVHMKGRVSVNDKFDEYKESFRVLENELKEYVLEQQNLFIPTKDRVSEQILDVVSESNYPIVIYTFNYTDVEKLSTRFDIPNLPPVYHLHGSLKTDDRIIVGIELEDFTSIPPQMSFLIKSNNPLYECNELLRDLDTSDYVIFFGHSINGMDFPYFKDFFVNLSRLPISQLSDKHVTIITKDEESAMQIKDNFRQNGIDVRNLFNRVDMEFIMTQSIYNGNKREIAKLENLKSFLLSLY